MSKNQIMPTWKDILAPVYQTKEYQNLWSKVNLKYQEKQCFPPKELIFRAFDLTSFEDVKVVILGQDPYHGDLQANGLSFSVSDHVKTPPSLQNIYKELESDLGIQKHTNELDSWAQQGVLMLNATLTVSAHEPNSHKDIGWEFFTDFVISEISKQKENVIFVLWGAFAQKKEILIDINKHYVIKSPHPSPFSARKGFFGSKPFSKINDYLEQNNKKVIQW